MGINNSEHYTLIIKARSMPRSRAWDDGGSIGSDSFPSSTIRIGKNKQLIK